MGKPSNIPTYGTCTGSSRRRRKKKKRGGKITEKIMVVNSPNVVHNITLHIQEAQQILSRINAKGSTFRHIRRTVESQNK